MTIPRKHFEREPQRLDFSDTTSKTKQSMRDECDVNQIMKRWRTSGEMSHLSSRSPTYGDFSNPDDYLSATLKCRAAQADFDALSARIRDRMGNDPAKLLAFMGDESNYEEAVALGLLTPPATPAPSQPPTAPAAREASPPPIVDGAVSGGD